MIGKKRNNETSNHTNGKDKPKNKEESDYVDLKLNSDDIELNISKPVRKNSQARCELESFGICTEIATKLKERGIHALFEVQQKVFFPVLNGENVIVASLTGSGKTLSFILPILEKCKAKGRFNQTHPVVIVLAPTRELAIQIANEFSSLASKSKTSGFYYKTAVLYGGNPIEEQINALNRGVDIVVGTPGRILDLIGRKALHLDNLRIGVLDEADKMLEMGFQEPIEEIYDYIYKETKKLQVCLFSATIHKWVIETAKTIMRNKEHTFVNLVANLKGRCAVGVEHLAVNCLKSEKITTIADLSK